MGGKLSFGFIYDFRNPAPWTMPAPQLYAETLDVMVETERLGFDGVWVPEHHLADDAYIPSPMMVLSAVAARTSRVVLGSAIALAPLYDPLRFAQDAAVLDIISNGRAELGLAIGYRRREYEAFGLDFRTRGKRFDEFLQVVRALWAGETVDFEGRHYTLKGAKVSPHSPRGQIPLYIGGFVEKAMQRVARYGDGYFGNVEFVDMYLAKLKEEGKDPAAARLLVPALYNFVARDPEAAMEELAPYYHHVFTTYGAWANEDQALGIDAAQSPAMDLEAFKKSGTLTIWTPEEAISRLRDLQASVPLRHYVMMKPPGLPARRFLDYASDFARDVIPAFA